MNGSVCQSADNFIIRSQMESGRSCSLRLRLPSTGYFTPPHHLTSHYSIRTLYFWQHWHKKTPIYCMSGAGSGRVELRGAALWHAASAGMAVLSSLNEDRAAAVWMSDG